RRLARAPRALRRAVRAHRDHRGRRSAGSHRLRRGWDPSRGRRGRGRGARAPRRRLLLLRLLRLRGERHRAASRGAPSPGAGLACARRLHPWAPADDHGNRPLRLRDANRAPPRPLGVSPDSRTRALLRWRSVSPELGGLRWRVSRRLGRGRVTAAAALALITPIALSVSALVTLVLITVVWFALHAYELIWWQEERARRRSERSAERSPTAHASNAV